MIRKILPFATVIFLIRGIIFIPPLWAASPLLQLQTDSSSVKVGEEFEVKICLDTLNQPTVGVDAILNFDPSFLKVERIDEGSIYPNYPAKIYQNDTGIIKIAGSADYNDYFSGQGILATLLFKAQKEGRTTIDFVWQPGGTKETNVVSPQKKDLLTSQPEGMEIEISSQTISQTVSTSTPSPSPSAPSSPSPTLFPTVLGQKFISPIPPSPSDQISTPPPQVLGKQKEIFQEIVQIPFLSKISVLLIASLIINLALLLIILKKRKYFLSHQDKRSIMNLR